MYVWVHKQFTYLFRLNLNWLAYVYMFVYMMSHLLNLAHTGQIKERRTPVNVDGGLF